MNALMQVCQAATTLDEAQKIAAEAVRKGLSQRGFPPGCSGKGSRVTGNVYERRMYPGGGCFSFYAPPNVRARAVSALLAG